MKHLFHILFDFAAACVTLWAAASLLVPEGGMILGGDDEPTALVIQLTHRLPMELSVGILASVVLYIIYALARRGRKSRKG